MGAYGCVTEAYAFIQMPTDNIIARLPPIAVGYLYISLKNKFLVFVTYDRVYEAMIAGESQHARTRGLYNLSLYTILLAMEKKTSKEVLRPLYARNT